MEILEVHMRECGGSSRVATVLHAYADAERARMSRRFLWGAIPIMTILLIAVQVADGLLARTSVAVILALGTAVAAAAAVEEWRASKRLRTLIRFRSDIS
jgi:hypothetical protein